MNRARLLVVILTLAGGAAAVLGRSAQVSVLDHQRWTTEAFEQQEKMIEIQGPRGRILSSDGYVLATSSRRWALQVDQHHLEYPELFEASMGTIHPLIEVARESSDIQETILYT